MLLNQAPESVNALINEARRGRYRMLQGFYHGAKMNLTLGKNLNGQTLHAVVMTGSAWACNKTLSELKLPEQLVVSELHRQQEIIVAANLHNITFRHGDVLILQGVLEVMPLGEAYLLRG